MPSTLTSKTGCLSLEFRVELPVRTQNCQPCHGLGDPGSVERPIGERPSLVRAEAIDRRDDAVDVEQGVDLAAVLDFLRTPGGSSSSVASLTNCGIPTPALLGFTSPLQVIIVSNHRGTPNFDPRREPVQIQCPGMSPVVGAGERTSGSMRTDAVEYDLVVVGGGIGGLSTAALANRRGLRVALLESHSRLGGCAGYFPRGVYTFDAGATALMGLGPDEPIGALLKRIGVAFEATRTPTYRVHLPDRTLDVEPDRLAFEAASSLAFPGKATARRIFWRLQEAVGTKLFGVASRVPRLPIGNLGDVVHDLKILGPSGLVAASTWVVTVLDVLRLLGLDRDVPFRSLIAMLLQDTAQAGPETVPFANAATCLQAYRMGMSRPKGGMQALAEGIGQAFAEQGGDLRTSTIVDRVEPLETEGFAVTRPHAATCSVRDTPRLGVWPSRASPRGRGPERRVGRRRCPIDASCRVCIRRARPPRRSARPSDASPARGGTRRGQRDRRV